MYMMSSAKNAAKIFEGPAQYGLRGDPYLWRELRVRYESTPARTIGDFRNMILQCFVEVTGYHPRLGKDFLVPEYDSGGMSGGGISSDFWIEKGFPILEKRFKEFVKNS